MLHFQNVMIGIVNMPLQGHRSWENQREEEEERRRGRRGGGRRGMSRNWRNSEDWGEWERMGAGSEKGSKWERKREETRENGWKRADLSVLARMQVYESKCNGNSSCALF